MAASRAIALRGGVNAPFTSQPITSNISRLIHNNNHDRAIARL